MSKDYFYPSLKEKVKNKLIESVKGQKFLGISILF